MMMPMPLSFLSYCLMGWAWTPTIAFSFPPVQYYAQPRHLITSSTTTTKSTLLEAKRRTMQLENATDGTTTPRPGGVNGERTSKEPKKEKKEEEEESFSAAIVVKREDRNEVLDAVWNVTSQVSKDVFLFLRRTAATALTSSLEPEERRELIQRLERNRLPPESVRRDPDEVAMLQKNSVNENIAAANAKTGQREMDPQTWEREKERIYQQAERAAEERVKTELAIQKRRMEQEKRSLQAQQQQQQQQQQSPTTTGREKELENKLTAMEKALQYKDQQAKKDYLEIVRLVQELNDAKVTRNKTPDAAKEWREDLSEEEKKTLEQLRGAQEQTQTGRNLIDNNKRAVDMDDHPVLGHVVEDLGYKRIHLASVTKLGSLPIYQKQRIYRQERVKAMMADKWKSMQLGLPGVICLHEDRNGTLSIVDGQHRVGMMTLLQEKQQKWLEAEGDAAPENLIDFDRVLVEVYPSEKVAESMDDDKHAESLFLEINKAEPVKLVDMPGVAKAKDRKIITDAVESLYDLYPSMFSPSQRCRTPNVNIDNMRDNLFGSDVVKKHNLTTSKKLLDWILKQNDLLAKKYENSKEEQSKISAQAWRKSSQNKFYLGLESNWLYN